MDEGKTLSHSKWECKYHVVFIPKCRRHTLYGQTVAWMERSAIQGFLPSALTSAACHTLGARRRGELPHHPKSFTPGFGYSPAG